MRADMLLVALFQCILILSSHISAQNRTSGGGKGKRVSMVRRQWPNINFEDLDIMSGDGPDGRLSDNMTETYVWTTIITQIKATVWPTITRSKVLTPKPKPIRVSSTPIISCHKFWSQISYDLPVEANSEDLLESILRRSSVEYPGPSSTIALFPNIASSDISMSSMSSFGSQFISISESTQSYFASKSVSPSDRLTQHFSTKDFTLSSSLEINFNSYSIPSIESSFAFEFTESVGPIQSTPIHWPSVSIESDKNSISGSLLSFSISNSEDIVSTDKPFITPFESSFRLISVPTTPTTPTTPSSQTNGKPNKTIDDLQPTPVSTKQLTTPSKTPTPKPLCPEGLQTPVPRESLEKPFEDYLIRTVLNNTSNEEIESIRNRIERNITQIYIYSLKRQHNITDQMAANTRKLLSKVNYTNIEVKLWDVIRSEGSDQIHVIYYVEKDGALIPYSDAAKTLSHISDDKYQEMIGLTVIEKVKPYNEVKYAESAMNWWSVILSLILAVIVIMCIPLILCLWWKSRSERRKLIDAFNSQLNRVVPDNQIHWRTVSKAMDPKNSATASTNDRPKADDNRNEFQYFRFESNVKQKEAKQKSESKATQIESSLEMQKQKVIPIEDLIDESTHTSARSATNEYIKTTFVTTKEIETKTDTNDYIPQLMSVQMSAQTESIIRAIRSELNRVGHTSNAIPFIDDTQPDESIISNSSEA